MDTPSVPCFLCLCDSRAKDQHYVRQEWPLRQRSKLGSHSLILSLNPINYCFHPYLSSLYMYCRSDLGVMKNFVKEMDTKGCGFPFFQEKFPCISMEKLKAGIFDAPLPRKLLKDPIFDEALSEAELPSWQSPKSVVTNFLGKHRSAEYEKEIEELLKSFLNFRVRISIKLHFLQSHFDYFFFKELWRFEWRVGLALYTKTFALWKSATKADWM